MNSDKEKMLNFLSKREKSEDIKILEKIREPKKRFKHNGGREVERSVRIELTELRERVKILEEKLESIETMEPPKKRKYQDWTSKELEQELENRNLTLENRKKNMMARKLRLYDKIRSLGLVLNRKRKYSYLELQEMLQKY